MLFQKGAVMQSRKRSALEIACNVCVKACTAWALYKWVVLPRASTLAPSVVVALMTVNSVVFGYALRRAFNSGERSLSKKVQ